MGKHPHRCIALLLGLLSAASVCAELESDLADLSARAAYGFYAQEPSVVEAARVGLEHLPASDARVNYQRSLTALRLAQLHTLRGRPAGGLLADCVDSAERAGAQNPTSAEPWILVAACAALAVRAEPLKAPLHARRFDQAVGHARSMDPANPRIALVTAWRSSRDPAELDAAAAGALTRDLETSAATFAIRSRDYAVPDWGEAETLTLLGALYLRRGDIRAARDVIEQALIAAPGYAHALDLRRKLEQHFVGARGSSL